MKPALAVRPITAGLKVMYEREVLYIQITRQREVKEEKEGC